MVRVRVKVRKSGVRAVFINGKRAKWIGAGSYRNVYRRGRLVVKLSLRGRGCDEQNQNEANFWRHADKNLRKNLAPIRAYGVVGKYSYNIQEYAGDIKPSLEQLYVVRHRSIHDLDDRNVRVDEKGQVRIVDYGLVSF